MLADIEAGKVATVIVKDMSRLGRNYLQVGMYTEMLAFAGIGVAMGNAWPDARAAADYITTDVDKDGIWNALEHFGLLK